MLTVAKGPVTDRDAGDAAAGEPAGSTVRALLGTLARPVVVVPVAPPS